MNHQTWWFTLPNMVIYFKHQQRGFNQQTWKYNRDIIRYNGAIYLQRGSKPIATYPPASYLAWLGNPELLSMGKAIFKSSIAIAMFDSRRVSIRKTQVQRIPEPNTFWGTTGDTEIMTCDNLWYMIWVWHAISWGSTGQLFFAFVIWMIMGNNGDNGIVVWVESCTSEWYMLLLRIYVMPIVCTVIYPQCVGGWHWVWHWLVDLPPMGRSALFVGANPQAVTPKPSGFEPPSGAKLKGDPPK